MSKSKVAVVMTGNNTGLTILRLLASKPILEGARVISVPLHEYTVLQRP